MTLPTGFLDGQPIHGSDVNATNTAANASTNFLGGATPGATLARPTIKGYIENQVAMGVVGASAALVATNGTQLTATLTSGLTTAFSMPTPVAGTGFTLLLKQAASGDAAATFAGVIWNFLGPPTITTTGGYLDILVFVSDGTAWYGTYVQGFGTGILTDVYLTNGNHSSAHVFELASDITQSTLGFSGLIGPAGVAVDSGGVVYVADTLGNVVYKLSGGVQTTLPFTGLNAPLGIAVDASGSVYVANSAANTALKLTSGGVQTTLPFTGLSTPVDIAVGADGSVYLSHSGRVDKLVGTTQTTLGFTGLTSAYGIAVDATNAVYVVDHTGHTVYRRLGSVQSVVGFTGLAGPVGVAVDSVGGVYVSDATNNAAYRLSGGVQTTLPFSTLVAPQFLAVTAA